MKLVPIGKSFYKTEDGLYHINKTSGRTTGSATRKTQAWVKWHAYSRVELDGKGNLLTVAEAGSFKGLEDRLARYLADQAAGAPRPPHVYGVYR